MSGVKMLHSSMMKIHLDVQNTKLCMLQGNIANYHSSLRLALSLEAEKKLW